MENVGAVKELSKITTHLEARISELEQDHKRCLLLANHHPDIALSDLSSKYQSVHHDLRPDRDSLSNRHLFFFKTQSEHFRGCF